MTNSVKMTPKVPNFIYPVLKKILKNHPKKILKEVPPPPGREGKQYRALVEDKSMLPPYSRFSPPTCFKVRPRVIKVFKTANVISKSHMNVINSAI